MGYKDWDKDIPLLVERIKIKLREQEIDFFDYVGKLNRCHIKKKSLSKKAIKEINL